MADGGVRRPCRKPSRADDYPNRPITLIVPFPPGGSTTVMARNVADKMSAALGQPIVVENRGGAGGTIGTRFAAKAAPDGYTILLSYTGTFSIAPSAYANPGYDPRKDFAPIGMIGVAPSLLVVHPSLPVHSMAELIAYAKAQASPLQYGSPGVGTVNHLAGELLANEIGAPLQHIPYKGNGPAIGDLLGGHIPMMFLPIPAAIGNVRPASCARWRCRAPAKFARPAGFADHGGGRRARLRRGAALRAGGAGRHAAADHRAAQQGAQRRARLRRGAEAAGDRRRRRAARQPRRPMPPTSTAKRRSGACWCTSSG